MQRGELLREPKIGICEPVAVESHASRRDSHQLGHACRRGRGRERLAPVAIVSSFHALHVVIGSQQSLNIGLHLGLRVFQRRVGTTITHVTQLSFTPCQQTANYDSLGIYMPLPL